MTKQEVLAKLAAKLDANQAEVRRQLEVLCGLPGHEIHAADEPEGSRVDMLQKLSQTWKEGRAITEVANELVGLVYPEPAPEQTKPTAPEMLQ